MLNFMLLESIKINKKKQDIMFGGMEEMQKKMQAQMQEALTAITVEAEAGGGLVKIKANAARQILDVSIDASVIDAEDKEGLEDLVLEAVNRVIHAATFQQSSER